MRLVLLLVFLVGCAPTRQGLDPEELEAYAKKKDVQKQMDDIYWERMTDEEIFKAITKSINEHRNECIHACDSK